MSFECGPHFWKNHAKRQIDPDVQTEVVNESNDIYLDANEDQKSQLHDAVYGFTVPAQAKSGKIHEGDVERVT